MATETTLIEAVAPSEMLTDITIAAGVYTATASHRRDGDCKAMYVVDVTEEPATKIWSLAQGWQDPGRIVPATSLRQDKGVWRAQVRWTPRPEKPEVLGVVVCIVSAGSPLWPMQEYISAQLKLEVAKGALAPLATPAAENVVQGLEDGPQDLVRVIEEAFKTPRKATTFNTAVLGE